MARIWSINGRFLGQTVTGVQRYAHEVVGALDEHLAAGHPLARGLDLELLVPAGCRPPRLQAIGVRRAGAIGGHGWEQLVLPRLVGGGLLGLGNTGPVALGRQIVCIHDANTRTCPASYGLRFRALYRVLHPALGRRAARIATVSEHSAGELERYGIARRDRIFVAHDGHEHALRWRPAHSPATRAAAGPGTVVLLGSPAPHKNIGVVLGLAPRLAAAGLRLAVAGERDARILAACRGIPAAATVHWLGRLGDEQLAALLGDSLCLAFPSLAEGFGLPALEAMALGCPVVASGRASLPEVCGDAALYAPAAEPDAWLASFLRLHGDPRLRRALAERGRARAARFSWRRTAEVYLEAMAEVDQAAGGCG